ncbi:hypothetical protein BDW74DRAFT_175898 [Aspergillus multicolor]|uniref:F-box domain protein n=1 Tax=Aspergillus multicolor TaxID=41759 RepID=UPI003CCCBB8A
MDICMAVPLRPVSVPLMSRSVLVQNIQTPQLLKAASSVQFYRASYLFSPAIIIKSITYQTLLYYTHHLHHIMPATTTIFTLPPELHLHIRAHLSFPSTILLRLTCRYFYALLDPLTHVQLLDAENSDFAVSKNLYACRYCLRLRDGEEFAVRMLSSGRGRRGADAGKRFCVECGVKPRGGGEARYGRGAMFVIKGELRIVCIVCGKFARGVREGSGGGGGRVRCSECGFEATNSF